MTTLSDDVRERLMALITADEELRAWLKDAKQLASGNESKALSQMLGHAHLLAETDPKAARLTGVYRVALAEPEITTPTRAPVVTDRSAAWFVREIKPLLATEPKFARALAEQQLALEASGQPRAEACAIVVRRVLQMSADGVKPLHDDSPLARVVRLAAKRIHNGTWRPEPPASDQLAESVQHQHDEWDPWKRFEQVHDPRHVQTIGGTAPLGIVDGREGASS